MRRGRRRCQWCWRVSSIGRQQSKISDSDPHDVLSKFRMAGGRAGPLRFASPLFSSWAFDKKPRTQPRAVLRLRRPAVDVWRLESTTANVGWLAVFIFPSKTVLSLHRQIMMSNFVRRAGERRFVFSAVCFTVFSCWSREGKVEQDRVVSGAEGAPTKAAINSIPPSRIAVGFWHANDQSASHQRTLLFLSQCRLYCSFSNTEKGGHV